MIIVRLFGGLGNQMFQYAYGRSLSLKYDQPLTFDTSFLLDRKQKGNISKRNYELGCFMCNPNFLSPYTQFKYGILFSSNKYINLALKFWQSFNKIDIYYEKNSLDNLNLCKGNSYHIGYYQSEAYFYDISRILRKDFKFNRDLVGKNKIFENMINGTDSISLHIRRGDYVTSATANSFHGLCSLDFYLSAIDFIRLKVSNPHFYVFSDDLLWVQKHLNIKYPVTYIDGNFNKDSYIDMQLMSLCKHNIISNSTFSWWGAWLNCNPYKIVVGPKQWFVNDKANIMPSNWIAL